MHEIFKNIRSYNNEFDEGKLKRALDFIRGKDDPKGRKISQSFDVLKIMLPMRPDMDTVLAAVLYSIYENGFISDEDVLKNFGQNVLTLLSSVVKLKVLNYKENDKSAQLEALRKMFLTMARDIRVVLLKLAVRLYKITHLDYFVEGEEKIAYVKETFNVFVPVASRLGIYRLKIDLEDASFLHLNPEEYYRISEQIEKLGKSRRIAIALISRELRDFVENCGFKNAEIYGRLKSVYSIYRKITRKNLDSINDIYDIFALRIILPSKFDENGNEIFDHLYSLLGMIHSSWKPVTKKFKDYITVPKPNGYRSLHTVVLGLIPGDPNKPVEIQLRSSEIHREAEYGVASHWIYKQGGSQSLDMLKQQVDWLKGLEKVREDFNSGSDILREVEINLFKDRIFVLTPKGEIKDLPAGSSPLDFAFAVHSNVGLHTIMAKVNGSIVPLNYTLKNGDVVEIVTKNDAGPKLQWLSLVKTNLAKNKIRGWFNRLNRENNIKQGRLLINKQLERFGLPSLDQNFSILKNYGGKSLTVADREGLVEEVGSGNKQAVNVLKNVYPNWEELSKQRYLERVKADESFINNNENLEKRVLIGGEKGLPVRFGACCNPKEKDNIVGYVTRGKTITIHSDKCNLLAGLNKERFVSASYYGVSKTDKIRKKIKVMNYISRVGFLRDLTAVIASLGLNIVDIKVDKIDEKAVCFHFVIDFDNEKQCGILMEKLQKVPDVAQVVEENL